MFVSQASTRKIAFKIFICNTVVTRDTSLATAAGFENPPATLCKYIKIFVYQGCGCVLLHFPTAQHLHCKAPPVFGVGQRQ